MTWRFHAHASADLPPSALLISDTVRLQLVVSQPSGHNASRSDAEFPTAVQPGACSPDLDAQQFITPGTEVREVRLSTGCVSLARWLAAFGCFVVGYFSDWPRCRAAVVQMQFGMSLNYGHSWLLHVGS